MPKGAPNRQRPWTCKTCQHPERARIDYLAATGAPLKPLAERYGLTKDSLTRHLANHISDDFKNAVKLEPWESEERLRSLCADHGVSALERLGAIYAPLAARYMVAFEAGADQTMIALAGKMTSIAMNQARLTRELMPAQPSMVVNNNVFLSPGWFEGFTQRMVEFARQHPEVREDLMAVLRDGLSGPKQPHQLIDVTPERVHELA